MRVFFGKIKERFIRTISLRMLNARVVTQRSIHALKIVKKPEIRADDHEADYAHIVALPPQLTPPAHAFFSRSRSTPCTPFGDEHGCRVATRR